MIETWSYSRYATYKQCPRKAKYLYVGKFKEPPSEALENGTIIHNKMEEYLTIDGMPVPVEAKSFMSKLEDLRNSNAIAETMWAFDSNFKPCDPWNSDVRLS